MDILSEIEKLEAALSALNSLLRSQAPSGPAALKSDQAKVAIAKVKLAQAALSARLEGLK